MSPTAITKADILGAWRKPAPKAIGRPDFDSLKDLRTYLKESCYDIDTTLGGGQDGHLFLILSDASYLAHAGVAFVAPAQPPIAPVIPAGSTGPQIAEIRHQHEQEHATYDTYKNVMAAARQIILDSVEPMYLRAIRNANTLFGHLSPRELLTFLSNRYGQLYPHEIEEVDKAMKEPWNPTDPFEVVIEQVDNAIDTMDSIQQPYSAQQINTTAYNLVHKTGLFNEECKTWRQKPEAEKTWANFKTQFLEAYRQLRADQTTTAGHLNFGQANVIAQQTADALDKLVASQENSTNTIQQVQQANAALNKDNNNLSSQLQATNAALADLTNLVQQMCNTNSQGQRQYPRKNGNGTYCWTHGFFCGRNHTSATCKNPAHGHKTEATADNRMGGSNRGAPTPNNNAYIDSGATSHYCPEDTTIIDKQIDTQPTVVELPDASHLTSTHVGTLPLGLLPSTSTHIKVIPGLNKTLVSVGQLVDNGCDKVTFDADKVTATIKDTTIPIGTRTSNGLWAPLPTASTTDNINMALAIQDRPTQRDLLRYMHATMFSPVKSTLAQAATNKALLGFPGLTTTNISQHLPQSMATSYGHMDQQRQGLRSTKSTSTPEPDVLADLLQPPPIAERTHCVYATIQAAQHTYSDQTGAFPHISSKGAKYCFVLYDFDSNSIQAIPLKNRTKTEIVKALKQSLTLLTSRGLKPRLHTLDNETSTHLKDYLREADIAHQLTPAGIHRRNAAERAIRTWKNHFIAGLATVDPSFPMHLWDELVPQSVITLNLLRQSRLNPNLSAYAQVWGVFDFNATPMAPPGIKVAAHIKPANRPTFGNHAVQGYYVGPCLEHYRCYRVYIPATKGFRVVDTIEFFPTFPMPKLSSADAATNAAKDLIHALEHPHPATPFPALGDPQLQSLRQLAQIFESAAVQDTIKKHPPSAAAAPIVEQPIKDTPLHEVVQPIPHVPFPDIVAPVLDVDTGEALTYRQLLHHPKMSTVWTGAAAEEFGRLMQGYDTIEGTNTMIQ